MLNFSVKTILLFLGIILVIAVVFSSDTLEINSDETNNTGEIKPHLASTIYNYAYYQGYNSEYGVVEIDTVGGTSTGDGVFHIRGAPCAFGASSSVGGRLNFGFNNPDYAMSGPPISYEVRATIRYINWNDEYGWVQLYVQHDDGSWTLLWQQANLDKVDGTWEVYWTSGSAGYGSDGSMNFRIFFSSSTWLWRQQPSCKVNIDNLRVKVNYERHAYYQYYTPEYNVVGLDAVGGDNIGTGVFHIRGTACAFGASSSTGARLNFGFNNPYYYMGGPPISYEVRTTVRYRNWNDEYGWVELYVQHDDGSWFPIWQKKLS